MRIPFWKQATGMEKEIAHIRYKMVGFVVVIAALATWQRDFVISGIMSHLYMNLTILGTFAFGLVSSFVFIAKLKNEIVAFQALREMSDDIRRAPTEDARDPLWRYYRCAEPARVFRRPRLLGHAYDLVTEELARTRKIRISVETMNTLVHKIEETINDEKSLIVYISGLLVFMGLIGTFIGLLHMVGAIGGIIGSLAKSSTGATSGAFAELLGALEEPLKGMASGFASSLFGLFSSLVVGLMARFDAQAAGVLKGAFESWLAGVAQLTEQDESVVTEAAPEQPTDAGLIRMVGSVLSDYAKVATSFDRASTALQDMRLAHATQSAAYLEGFEALSRRQETLIAELTRVASGVLALSESERRQERIAVDIGRRVEVSLSRLGETLRAMESASAAAARASATDRAESAAAFARALETLSSEIERRTSLPGFRDLESVLESALRSSSEAWLEETRRGFTLLASSLEAPRGAPAQTPRSAPADSLPHEFATRVEAAISEGLGRVSQSVEAAFLAYSSLSQVALAALETSKAKPSADAAPPSVHAA